MEDDDGKFYEKVSEEVFASLAEEASTNLKLKAALRRIEEICSAPDYGGMVGCPVCDVVEDIRAICEEALSDPGGFTEVYV